jgi:hypothetical protein
MALLQFLGEPSACANMPFLSMSLNTMLHLVHSSSCRCVVWE